jgi:hypothetical protein
MNRIGSPSASARRPVLGVHDSDNVRGEPAVALIDTASLGALRRERPDLRWLQPAQAPAAEPNAADAERLARRDSAALRSAFRVFEAWGLSARESCTLLGLGNKTRTLYNWIAYVRDGSLRDPLPRDTLERVSMVLGIWKATQILFPDSETGLAFLRAANSSPICAGDSPLQRMLRGGYEDLLAVRRWLDSWRG